MIQVPKNNRFRKNKKQVRVGKPPKGMLGHQESCTADRGCRTVSVEIVVLLSTFD